MSTYPDQDNRFSRSDLLILVLLSLTAVLFLPLNGVAPSPDSSAYLKKTLILYNDFSYDNLMIRRPLYPLMLSLSFRVLGNSIENAFLVVRLFFLLNILLSYAAGWKMFNRSTGLAFALLLFSSFTVNQWSSYLLLDAVIPFFVLLFILLLYKASEAENRGLFIFAGILLGMMFLIKGVFAFFFMFLPMGLPVLKKYRTKQQVINTLLLYAVCLLILSPWLWYCIGERDLFILLGPILDAAKIKSSMGIIPPGDLREFSLWRFVLDQSKEILTFYTVYVEELFILSNLFVVSFLYVLAHIGFARNSRRPLILLFLMLFLFSPIIYIGIKSGGANFRAGQFLILYVILYLMLSFMIADVSSRISRVFGGGQGRIQLSIFILLLLPCLLFQIFIGSKPDKSRSFLALARQHKVSSFYGFSFWQGEFDTNAGWSVRTVRETADWLKANVSVEETILCQWFYSHMLEYMTENQYDLHKIQYNKVHDDLPDTPLFVWTRYRYSSLEGNRLHALNEEGFLDQVNGTGAKYVLVTHRRNFFSLYLEKHPDFELIHSVTREKRNIKVYRTLKLPVSPIPEFDVKFERDVFRLFRHAFEENPSIFRKLKIEIKKILNWPDEELSVFFQFVEKSDQKGFRKAYEVVNQRAIY